VEENDLYIKAVAPKLAEAEPVQVEENMDQQLELQQEG